MTDADGDVKDDKSEEKNLNDSKMNSDNEKNAAAINSPKKKTKNIKEEEKVDLMDKINEDFIAESSEVV